MERNITKGPTMVLNQFSRRNFKRREGTGRLTTKRLISFDSLMRSGKKPVPLTSSSLYRNISTTLKENVNPESTISQNVDDFWAVERQKRISAVARRKLSGAKEATQSVEDRKTRHARSRRVGGRRTLGAKPKQLDVYIDADLIADWDKENLEVEEEKPCTIASSEVFMSAQETALKASLPLLNTMNHPVEAVSGACSPIVETTHTEACSVVGEPKEQIPWHDDQANDVQSSGSLEDMDLSSGESPDYLMQNIMNPHDCTPDLASLVEMDWNTSSSPRVASENILNSQGSPGVRPDRPRGDCLVAETQADHRSPASNAHLRSRRFEHEERVNEDQGCINSLLMHCNLDEGASCANHDGTPLHDTTSQRPRLHMTSPTPPPNPFAVYMSRRQLSNEMGEFGQRKLAFGSSSSSSSLDIGDDCQNEEIPDLEVHWDRISYNDDPHCVNISKCDHEVANTHRPQNTPGKESCSGLAFPHDRSDAKNVLDKVHVAQYQGSESERYVCDANQSQESCSMHVKTSIVKSESRHKSGSNFFTETFRGKSVVSPGVDGPRTNTVTAIKMQQAEKAGLSRDAKALSLEDQGAETPGVSTVQVSGFRSDKTKQAETMRFNAGKVLPFEGLNEDTQRSDERPFSPIKSVKTKQVEKTRLSSAAKSLRFEGEDMDSSRACKPPVSASEYVRIKQAEKTGLSSAAKALSFEDVQVEATNDDEKAESLIGEPQEVTKLQVSLPADIEENISQPCANLHSQPDDITIETKTCSNLQSQPDEITAETQPCNPQSQSDNIIPEKLQPEPLQESQVKKPRRKAQDRRSSLEGTENGLTWKDGLRRSQRRRVRPLQWWRGEKLLYGRVHDSLTTVIGIKQSSPGQYARGIKAPFVIESFVSAEYNDLVRFAAI